MQRYSYVNADGKIIAGITTANNEDGFVINLFTYGSLMFAPVWQTLVSGRYDFERCQLYGFERFAVRGEEYPVIKPGDDIASVSGVVYLAVAGNDIARLDDFEGEYYRRTPIEVIGASGAIAAQAYVLRPRFYSIASNQPWNEAQFAKTGIKAFMAQYKGFSGVS